jgi:hypothetical protein
MTQSDLIREGTQLAADVHHSSPSMPPTTTLVIDIANQVDYREDVFDASKFATLPGTTPAAAFRNFPLVTLIGDIVAVNLQPAKGSYFARTAAFKASAAPGPGGAIADVTRTSLREAIFEILQPNGTPIGTVMTLGFAGGPPPPGQPSTQKANFAITGGTGAFLGARGQSEGHAPAANPNNSGRTASIAEDPGNRRVNGGLPTGFVLHLIPMTVPEIVVQPTDPRWGMRAISSSSPMPGPHPRERLWRWSQPDSVQ